MKPLGPSCYSTRLLVADDDVPLSNFLRRGLQTETNGVDVANDGEAALQALSQNRYSLLILDLNLPKRDGMSILEEIRPKSPMMPIMVLTARSRLDKIMALDAGADDCMIKPFSFQELLARTRALMRRNVGCRFPHNLTGGRSVVESLGTSRRKVWKAAGLDCQGIWASRISSC